MTVGGLSSGLRESGPSHATWLPRQRPTRGGGRFHMHARGGGKRGSGPPPRGVVVAMALPPNLTKAFFRYPKSLSPLWYCLPLRRLRQRRHGDLLVDGSSRYKKAIYTFIKGADAANERASGERYVHTMVGLRACTTRGRVPNSPCQLSVNSAQMHAAGDPIPPSLSHIESCKSDTEWEKEGEGGSCDFCVSRVRACVKSVARFPPSQSHNASWRISSSSDLARIPSRRAHCRRCGFECDCCNFPKESCNKTDVASS